jgi:hypothetical protein
MALPVPPSEAKKLIEAFLADPDLRAYIEVRLGELFASKSETDKHIAALNQQHRELLEELRREMAAVMKRLEEGDKERQALLARIDELLKRLAEHDKKFEETMAELRAHDKKFEEMLAELRAQREQTDARLKQHDSDIEALSRRMDSTLGALGARWGVASEASFRDAMQALLEESFPVKVERYQAFDTEGLVFGDPDQVELDLIIRNGEVIAVEIKSSMSKGDMYTFLRKVRFYERKENRKVTRKIVVSPMVDYRAKPVAQRYQIEVYSFPDNIPLPEEKRG